MRIKQMIIHSNLCKMKNQILPTCLQGTYRQFRRIQQYIIWRVWGWEVNIKTSVKAETLSRTLQYFNFFNSYNHLQIL